jgi:hypothetical protein
MAKRTAKIDLPVPQVRRYLEPNDQFKIVADDVAVIVAFGSPTSGTIGSHV